MREEATIEEWRKLYQIATQIKEQKPWESFGSMDLICLREGQKEDAAFVSVLGKDGDCYGIAIYEGYEGLNDFMMLAMQEELNLSTDYAVFSQNNLTCYWGNREDITEEQRERMKELGYQYHGKNQWLYFISYAAGYMPYDFDRNDVLRMTHYLESLSESLKEYEKGEVEVAFDKGNMYCYSFDSETGNKSYEAEALPFTAFEFEKLVLTDEVLVTELKNCNRSRYVLEAETTYLGTAVEDERYTRPQNPQICSICDAKTEMVLRADMIEPEVDASIFLAENIVDFIFRFGAPEEIRISNQILKAALEQLCELAGITLTCTKRLRATEKFLAEMER